MKTCNVLDETQISQFYAFCRHVRRPLKKRDSPRYIGPTVKNAAKVMMWGVNNANGRRELWFMPEELLSMEQSTLTC